MRNTEVRDIESLPLSEDYFESQSLKSAVWQYLLDHGQPVGRGMARVLFHITTENPYDFWRRVRARKEGRFKRVELIDFERDQKRIDQEWFTWKKRSEKIRKKDKRLRELQTTGPLPRRLLALSVMWLRQLANRIQERLTKEIQ